MKEYFEIVDVQSRLVKDLKGNDTIEVEVTLDDGTVGRACVSAQMVDGLAPELAADNVNTEIEEALLGLGGLLLVLLGGWGGGVPAVILLRAELRRGKADSQHKAETEDVCSHTAGNAHARAFLQLLHLSPPPRLQRRASSSAMTWLTAKSGMSRMAHSCGCPRESV